MGAATEAAASLAAPLLGGLLTDRLSWRWCFFIELPLIASAFLAVTFSLHTWTSDSSEKSRSVASRLRDLDVVGTALFVAAITTLLLPLQWGGNSNGYAWSDWRVLLPLCLSVALLAVFAWHQVRAGEQATLPPRILLRRSVLFGFLFSFGNNGSLNVIEYYVGGGPLIFGIESASI